MSLDFGFLSGEHKLKSMYQTLTTKSEPIQIRMNLRYREVHIMFPVQFRGGARLDSSKNLEFGIIPPQH